MELPHLGKHCSEDMCRRLDFLPVKCDSCKKVFCGDHYPYASHNCPIAYKKNVQVPVCPLCNAPVPGKLDELPDIRVSRHIDADCKSDTAVTRRQNVYTNKCSNKGCKQKEMIEILCDKCDLNYCLKHRHPQDHACSGISSKRPNPSRNAGQAALARMQSSNSSTKSHSGSSFSSNVGSAAAAMGNGLGRMLGYRPTALQGTMSEEQALQLALQASMNETSGRPQPTNTTGDLSQEQEDFLLAKAIAESEREANTNSGHSVAAVGGTRGRRSHSNCDIS